MSKEVIITVLKRAVEDEAFRASLKSDPDGALAGFDLTEAERAALSKVDDSLFEGPKEELEQRLSRTGLGLLLPAVQKIRGS